jgi:hypothetical protein
VPLATAASRGTRAYAAGCATRGFFALLTAALRRRPVTLDCGFSPNWSTLADVHISRGAASRKCASPKSAVITKRFNFTIISIPLCEFNAPTFFVAQFACQKRQVLKNQSSRLSGNVVDLVTVGRNRQLVCEKAETTQLYKIIAQVLAMNGFDLQCFKSASSFIAEGSMAQIVAALRALLV